MSNKKYTEIEKVIAREILMELEQQYKTVKGNDACLLFCHLRNYINEKYLSEDNR